MGSLFRPPEVPKTSMPSPKVVPTPEMEEGEDLARFGKKTSGRQDTIKTGMLIPEDIGKRRLLG